MSANEEVGHFNFDIDGRWTWNRNTFTFVTEHSSLPLSSVPRSLSLRNPATSVSQTFEYMRPDYYGTGEDREIAGWHYRSREGVNLLIIND